MCVVPVGEDQMTILFSLSNKGFGVVTFASMEDQSLLLLCFDFQVPLETIRMTMSLNSVIAYSFILLPHLIIT